MQLMLTPAVANAREFIPLTAESCAGLSGRTAISKGTAEFVANAVGESPRSISLWRVSYLDSLGGICTFFWDTPHGVNSCWTGVATSQNAEIAWAFGKPSSPFL